MSSQKSKFESCDFCSSSIAAIVRYSMNEKFRKKCYQVLDVNSTQALEAVINQKLRKVCSVETTAMKKVPITSSETDIVLSEGEDSPNPPEEPTKWLFPSAEQHKSLKRSVLFEDEKENTPVKKVMCQRGNSYQSAGKVARMSFSQSKSAFLYKSPSQRYLEDAMNGQRRRDRTQDVPEQTRKVLFFDDKPVTKLF